jgi:transposase
LQRKHDLRAVFNGLRYLAHTGAPWRYLPGDFPPWAAVDQPARRWMAAGCFEALVHDVRLLLRVLPGGDCRDARVLQSPPESGARAGYNGHKRCKGSKVHAAVDTLGQLLALVVTPANLDESARAHPGRGAGARHPGGDRR